MKKRRSLLWVLALCLGLLFLFGCSNPSGGGTEGPGSPEDAPAADLMSPADPVTFPSDAIRSPAAKWEQYCHIEGGVFIEGLNFAPDRTTLWVIDPAAHNIYRVVDGEAETVFHDETCMPNGAKFIDENTLLITDRARGLCKFDTETLEYTDFVTSFNGVNFLGPNDLVLDGQGGAYFTDPGSSTYTNPNGSVYYVNYSAETPALQIVETGIAYPNGITLSPDGTMLYVAEFNSNSILCVPSLTYGSGPVTTYLLGSMSGGHGPDGLTIDTEGNIYAAHLEAGEVVVFSPGGYVVDTIRMPAGAGIFTDNLILHDGYLYVCEFGQSIVWRIPVSMSSGEV